LWSVAGKESRISKQLRKHERGSNPNPRHHRMLRRKLS
jgi:hypothetical protein